MIRQVTLSHIGPGPSDHLNQTVLAAFGFHSMEKNGYDVNGYQHLFLLPTFFEISSCVLYRRKKLIHILNIRVSNQSLFSPVKAGKHWSKQSLNRINLLAKSDQLQGSFCYIADLILDKPTPNNNPIQDALGTSEALQ